MSKHSTAKDIILHSDLQPLASAWQVDLFKHSNGYLLGSDTCVCCGEYVPEGYMVCPACESGWTQENRKSWERKRGENKCK